VTAFRRTQADSDDRLAPVGGRRCDLHRLVDRGLIGIREGRVADMHPAAIGAGEGGGDAREGAQGVADRRPACGHTGLGHARPEDLDRLIGDDGDEEMSIGAPLLVMIDRTQTELGRAGTEDGFPIRAHRVGLSHDCPMTVPSPPRPRRDPSTAGGRRRAFGRREPAEGFTSHALVPARVFSGSGVTVIS